MKINKIIIPKFQKYYFLVGLFGSVILTLYLWYSMYIAEPIKIFPAIRKIGYLIGLSLFIVPTLTYLVNSVGHIINNWKNTNKIQKIIIVLIALLSEVLLVVIAIGLLYLMDYLYDFIR